MKEIEVRAVVDAPDSIKKNLENFGFESEDIYVQHDMIFDRSDFSLFKAGQKIRIRIEKGKAELTYKGKIEQDANVSKRTELNIPIEVFQVPIFSELLHAIGYPLAFQIKKERHKFVGEDISVTFDEWPIIGCLLEIEGDESKINKLAKIIAPNIEFGNFRLAELFKLHEKKVGKSITECVEEYEKLHNFKLGRMDLI